MTNQRANFSLSACFFLGLLLLALLVAGFSGSSSPSSAKSDRNAPKASYSAVSGKAIDSRTTAQPHVNASPTEASSLATSSLFGEAGVVDLNQVGDYAFIGQGSSAVFFRPAGSGTTVRVFQMSEAIPGIPGSRADILGSPRLNSSGKLVFVAQLSGSDGLSQAAILVYNGTSLQRIVSSADIAPGTGGAVFGRTILFAGMNDNGDIAFTGSLLPLGSTAAAQTTLFIIPNGGSPIRIAGPGDPAPSTGGTFNTITLASGTTSLNNAGEVLFRAQVVGGTGGFGLFAGSTLGLRKVVANGDPIPGGGTFSFTGSAPSAFFNNQGQAAFSFSSPGAVFWIHTPGVGITRAAGSGDAAPGALGGTLSLQSFFAFNDSGNIVFTAAVNGSGVTPRGLFRFVPGTGVQTVAFANQPAPGASPATFSTFGGASLNSSGLVGFMAALTGGTIPNGIFQQSTTNAPVNMALQGQATPLAGGGSFSLLNSTFTRTLNGGATYFWADVFGGTATYAEFLGTPGSLNVLMNDADTLPAGSRTSLRTFRVGAAGDYVGFLAQQTGGRFSIMVRNITTGGITSTVMTDGDTAPGTGGGRFRTQGGNTVFVNSSGNVAFSSPIIGGTQGNGIFRWTAAGGVTKVVAVGDSDPTSGSTFTSLSLSFFPPSPLNGADKVAFLATVLGKTGIYLGTSGSPIQRLMQSADAAPGGGTFSSVSSTPVINQSGQVAFFATTTGGPGLNLGIFVATPGVGVAKVAVSGDPAIAGGTFAAIFSGFSFNDSGEVAFTATLNGAVAGGVFVGSASSIVPVALDGAASPAGGNFSLASTSPNILINNQHDVVFRALLAGGSADSGYFLRRGAGGALQNVVMQGQAAPGTSGTFLTISGALNNLVGENFALGPTGEVTFNNSLQTGAGFLLGEYRFRTDNLLEKIFVQGNSVPNTGNGIFSTAIQGMGTGGPGHFAFWIPVVGGNVDDLIYVTNSPAGFGISGQVKDVSGIGIGGVSVALSGAVSGTTTTDNAGNYSFANLTNGGNYTATPSSGNFSFTPTSQTFNNLNVDRIANFVATQTIVSITGKVTDAGNTGINNVTVALTQDGDAAGTVQTDGLGNYTLGNLAVGANYVVTPVGTFTPSSQTLSNLTVNATANFKSAPTIAPQCATPGFSTATSFGVGSKPFSVGVGDFNNDGKLDLALTNSGSANVSILVGTGTGSFNAATNFAVSSNPRSVAVGDYDGDGNLDLAVANRDTSNVSILLGTGTGSFSAATNFGTGVGPFSIVVGDFNGDGRLDLATANDTSNDISILLGTGTGNFGTATNFALGAQAVGSAAVGDFNGDGNLDLAVPISGTNVSILLGTGTGNFGPATNFAVGVGPRSIAVADFNGDGKLDLAVANESVPTVSILLGTGTGGFSAPNNFAAGSQPSSIAVADFNGDGHLDVAINNPGFNVSVMLGNGAGSLGSTNDFASGDPFSVAVGDFNSDGKSDLAVANFSSDNVSVLLNNGATCNSQTSVSISGRTADSNNNPQVGVTVTLAGPTSRVVQTDIGGNYSFANLTPGGNYSVTVQSNYFVFAPSRADFFNLSSNQTANFVAAPVVVPSPSPPLTDDFTSPTRDATKWTIGTQTEPATAFDPQVTTAQVNGQLVITPLSQAVGMHYDGYIAANSFDMRNGKVTVEVVKAATGGADTIFAIGSDADNFFRFLVHTAGTPTALARMAKGRDGIERPLDTSTTQLIFQVNLAGQLASFSIPYDPVQQRFMRFRHEVPAVSPPAGAIVFETSPNNIDFTVQHRVLLQRGLDPLTAELSAGTSSPTNPGQAVFDNFGLVTSTFQFNAANYTVGEGDGVVTITVTRVGAKDTAATVDFSTMDGTALQRSKYIGSGGTLAFVPGQMSQTFQVLIEDNALAEGDESLNLFLTNPVGSGLNSPGRAVLTIADNDTTLATGNPLDDPVFFTTQQYYDFLNRGPDPGGLNFWVGSITQCGSDQNCIKNKRVDVSNAFFYEQEFQQTGAYVYRVYRVAYGNNQPFPNPDANPAFPNENKKLPSYDAFVPDRARVVGGTSLAQAQLDLATAFVQRPEFVAKYPLSLATAGQFVDAILSTILSDLGVNLSGQRSALIALYNQGSDATKGRVNVLYRLADDNAQTNPINNRALIDEEYVRGFVTTQYFGYLRRDADIGGLLFWFGQVSKAPLRDVPKQHAMVCSFITSAEYQQRFSPIVTHTNAECPQ